MDQERRRVASTTLLLVALCLGQLLAQDIGALAAEYRQLRAIQGWFDGGDEFIDKVDRWGGRKHELMQLLGRHLGDGTHPQAEVEDLLGAPDRVVGPGEPYWQPHQADRLLIYTWRGYHDYMYFIVQDGKVLGVDWWMAYE